LKNEICGMVVLAMLLAVGCSSGDGEKEAADAIESARDAAGDVVETAADAAEDVAEEAMDDPTKRCLELAAEKKWKDALEPCSEAVKAKPDDLAIKHAFQQAQAAAQE